MAPGEVPARRRVVLGVAVVAIMAVSFGLSRASTPVTEAGPQSVDKVVVFAVPGLSIDDLDDGPLTNLDRLAEQGSIAAANVRIKSAAPNLAGAYASLGAGNRTKDSTTEALAYDAGDRIGGRTVAEEIQATTGESFEGTVAVPTMAKVSDEVGPEGGAQPGSLAEALHAGGRRTAVVTNASSTITGPDVGRNAPAALAVATPSGEVDRGNVDADLLSTVPGPDGLPRAVVDDEVFRGAVDDAVDAADVVIVDPGETTRAMAAAEAAAAAPDPPDPADPPPEDPAEADPIDQLRVDALARTDRLLGQIQQDLDAGTLLLVVGVTPPTDTWALTPVVASGSGVPPGYLSSASTHRPGLVTLTDLAPSILETLGTEVPPPMIGAPLRYRAADSSWDQARRLDSLLESQASVSLAMTVTFITVQSVLYGIAFLLLASGRGSRGLRRLMELGALACGAWPVATFLLRTGTSLYSLGPGTFVLSWLIAVFLALGADRFRRHPLDPALAISGLTVAVLVADLTTGSHLQLGSFFGYPPQTAPRFIGLGNSAFAILAGATMVTIGLVVGRARDTDGDRSQAWWIALAIGVLATFAIGAPWTGADVGGTLAFVPVLSLALWVLRGGRIRWEALAVALLLGVVVLGLGVGVEALRDPSERTHIGRFFLNSGDSSSIVETLRRKWNSNTAAVRQSPGTLAVPVVVAFAVAVLGRLDVVRRRLPGGSAVRVAVLSSLAVGTAGWLLNDSGLIVLALACVPLGPLLVIHLLGSTAEAPSPLPAVTSGFVTPEPADTTETGTEIAEPIVVALVPAKDRADSIEATVAALQALDEVDRVLVVDDGSTDATGDLALTAGADVLRLPVNRGKGGAVLEAARATPEADIYLLIDADLARTASAAGDLIDPVRAGDAELTIGVLPPAAGRGGFGAIRGLSARGVHRACGFEPEAPLSGQRAIQARFLRDLDAAERFGLEVAMTIDVVRAGGRVVEVSVPMDHRHTGRSLAGFAHRGRQGLDIARSLWPRLVSRPVRLTMLAGLVVLWVLGSYVSATAAVPDGHPATEPAEQVVVFGVPQLGLEAVNPTDMPNLYRLSEAGAFGLATPRTRGGPAPLSGYATIGAGDRARAVEIAGAPGGMGDESSAAVHKRRSVTGSEPVFEVPAMTTVVARTSDQASSRPGALGTALRSAGRRTALVASSASARSAGPTSVSGTYAPAALAIADQQGFIDTGEADPAALLEHDSDSPFGVRAAPAAFADAVTTSLNDADVVFVDAGETDRLDRSRPLSDPTALPERRDQALRRTDQVLGAVAEALPASSRLIVVGVTPASGDRLVPVVVRGGGLPGHRLTSPSTRRPDLVTLTDLAPTVIEGAGVAVPGAMIGQAIQYQEGRPDRDRLTAQDELNGARDRGYGRSLNTFIWAVAILYAVAAVVLLAPVRDRRVRRGLRFAALTTISWPLATFVIRGLGPLYDLGTWTHVLLWALAAGLAALAGRLRRHPLDPVLAIGVLTLLLTGLDLATGARLQTSSYLGYTPAVAARFVGLGNAAFGVFAAATVVTCSAWMARTRRPRDTWWILVAIAVAVIVADGAPWLGSDVGGILTLVPSFGLLLLLLAGRRPTLRSLLGLAGATVTLLAVAVGIEALRPVDRRTHIGQFFLSGDQSGFWTTLARKWDVNVGLLTSSNWTWLIVVVLAFVVVGRGWPHLAGPGSAERAGLLGLGAVALLGWVTNDSGTLVAAMTLVYLGGFLLALATFGDRGPRSAEPVLRLAARPSAEVRA